MPGYV